MQLPLFFLLYSSSVFSGMSLEQCKVVPAKDGSYYFLETSQGRTVSSHFYWKRAPIFIQAIRDIFRYGTCKPWYTDCVDETCKNVEECTMEEAEGDVEGVFLKRGEVKFTPIISEEEGGAKVLAELLEVLNKGHICYGKIEVEEEDEEEEDDDE